MKKMQVEKVTKPYLKGSIVDKTTLPGALKFFLATVMMSILFMIVCAVMNWNQAWLCTIINLAIVLSTYMMYAQFGMSAGANAVNQGEIMLTREEKGRPVADWERKMCYHPLKGAVIALMGSVPLVLCSILLACVAKRQMTGLGALPSWLGSLEGRQEIGNALAIYHETGSLGLEGLLRLIIRMSVMPYVNMIGAADKDGMLLLERLSPLVNLLPAMAYGIGYMRGVQVRSRVHTNIALGKKKAKRKQAKERRARRSSGPEMLN